MSMPFINFESSREKDKRRQWEREARQAIIEKAKNDYETKQRNEKEAFQRGEHAWMLPSVESKLLSNKHKTKKKKEKKKRSKKSKKKKKNYSSSTSSDSEEEEGVWVEKPMFSDRAVEKITTTELGTSKGRLKDQDSSEIQTKRDEWMEMTSLFRTYSRDEIRECEGTSRKKIKEEEKKRKQEAEKSLAKFNELLAEAEGKEKKKQEVVYQRKLSICKERSRSRERARGRGGHRSRNPERKTDIIRDVERSNRRDSNKLSEDSSWKYGRKSKKSKSKGGKRSKIKGKNPYRRYSSCSSRSSSSSSGRTSSSGGSTCSSSRIKDVSKELDGWLEHHRSPRSTKGLMRSPDDLHSGKQPSYLSSKFQKPEDNNDERSARNLGSRSLPSGNYRWKKKECTQEFIGNEMLSQKQSLSPSLSSSSESSDLEEEHVAAKIVAPGKEALSSVSDSPPLMTTVMLTDKEMNELAAKIMKAELVGNDSQASKLKIKLEAARTARANTSVSSEVTKETENQATEQVVFLSRLDHRGIVRPVPRAEHNVGGGKKTKKAKTHSQDGTRARYFPDDDQHDLKYMFEREKGTSAEDQNSMFERAAMQNVERLDNDYDMDDMFMSKAALRDTVAKQAERDKQKAIQEHRCSERSLESCKWCFDNKEMPKHLIVALGTKSYVCLPNHESLTPGHCHIVPVHHIACSVQSDEDLWSEIQTFRKSLVKMFNSRGEDCIFFEITKKLKHYPHMVITCIPLPREIGDMAPIYFKKAIMECEGEWALNKKLVDLKNRDVRRAVPKGLPYFFVDFAMEAGYAHVIEDEHHFPNNFAQEIVGGMMDLDNNLWRKPRKENFDAQRRKVMEFSRWYKEFDPTQDD
ncbi:uncharacterized protein [Panulirus ornatus]|uniref:uncharacterized protein isoform X3 n=1 Tax=Panulirus ornatus TaxID=150431 RepID=UPI003A861805